HHPFPTRRSSDLNLLVPDDPRHTLLHVPLWHGVGLAYTDHKMIPLCPYPYSLQSQQPSCSSGFVYSHAVLDLGLVCESSFDSRPSGLYPTPKNVSHAMDLPAHRVL